MTTVFQGAFARPPAGWRLTHTFNSGLCSWPIGTEIYPESLHNISLCAVEMKKPKFFATRNTLFELTDNSLNDLSLLAKNDLLVDDPFISQSK